MNNIEKIKSNKEIMIDDDKKLFENPISISNYIDLLNQVLKKMRVKLIGEVTQLKFHIPSGHVYFTLKDKDNGSIINCVIWKSVYQMCGVKLKEGMEVVILGSADIYPVRGSLTFKAETVELVGEGALKKAYDELKKKLSEEGIFDLEKKRPIPEYPQKIGVITSIHGGTVIHDFTSNLGKFGFKIKAMNSKVEGQEAVKELINCIRSFKKKDIDVLVIIRGGGSLESLMAFDNEMLVREISSFPVPVIAGIGHHKDVTLSSLAADAMESTPTATAHILNKSWERAIYKVDRFQSQILQSYSNDLIKGNKTINRSTDKIMQFFRSIFDDYKKIEEKIKRNVFRMKDLIIQERRNIDNFNSSLIRGFLFLKDKTDKNISELEKTVNHNSPERQLKLGYSIARFNGSILRSVKELNLGDNITVDLLDGSIDSEVKNKKDKK